MVTTPRRGLEDIGTTGKNLAVNNSNQLDDIDVQAAVEDKDLTAPPGSPSDGQMWIVGAAATGAWAGQDGKIAYYRSGWVFRTPWEGYTVWVKDENARYDFNGSNWIAAPGVSKVIIVAVSDETTPITSGTNKLAFRMPFAMTVTSVRASLTTASSSGGPVMVDINEAGSSILSTKLTIDDGEKTSTTAATPPVISDASLADDAEITIDIDAAGTGATGLKVTLIGAAA